MKSSYYFIAVLGVCLSFPYATCKKTGTDEAGLKDGILTGYDQRLCPCCGGLMITFNGETKPYIGTFYLMDNDPAEFGLSASESFPQKVKVKYTVLDKCNRNFIHATSLVKQ